MKKFLLICILLVSSPVFSLCSIDSSSDSICSISGMGSNSPIFQTPNSGLEMNNSQEVMKPLQQENSLNKALPASSDSIMKYNSGCQFGICVQDLNNTKNKNE